MVTPAVAQGIPGTPGFSEALPQLAAVARGLEVGPPPKLWLQEWADGWRYQGEFLGSLKHGDGRFEWSNGEYYVGRFFQDHRHGLGCYIWPDGTKFTGMFYLDQKEGYGTLEMKDGSMFQGLYKDDERFGPGVLTYPDGCQDVGLWYGNQLVRLCTTVAGGFTAKDHLAYQSDVGKDVIAVEPYKGKYSWRTDSAEDPFFCLYKKFLFDDSYTLPPGIGIYSSDADHLPLTRSYRRECDRHFFPEEELTAEDQTDTLTVINKTPLLVKMQMHIHRHRHAQTRLLWDVAAVIEGNRDGFGPKGPLECLSEELIIAAGRGDHDKVCEVLKTNLISTDVADLQGHTALIGASIACGSDIINSLLDAGANVNKVNNEGVSALNCSITLYYPVGCFKYQGAPAHMENKKIKHVSGKTSQRKISQKESVAVLTEEVRRAKKLSISKRKFEFGSIVLNQPPLISSGEEVLKGFEESGEEGVVSETDDSSESLQLSSIGSPSFGDHECKLNDWNYLLSGTGPRLHHAANTLIRSKKFRESAKIPAQGPAGPQYEDVRRIAEMKSEHQCRKRLTNLLLRRGADPNTSTHPMPSIFFPVLAADFSTVKTLLEIGADPNVQLQTMMEGMNGLLPLHIASTLPSKKGVMITELLLKAGANPDVGAEDKYEIYGPDQNPEPEVLNEFVVRSPNLSGVPKHYYSPPEILPEEDGRTALHMACSREDDYKQAHQIVQLLLKHKANPNLLWSGHSPLSLAIASGNDLAVDELLANRANPNLPLTHGLGNALSVALSIRYENKRSLQTRVALITKLIAAGANILMPVTIHRKSNKAVGTAVDYAHYKYYQDKRIAQTPYHALTPEEREVYNARRFLLNFLAEPFRAASIERERTRLDQIIQWNTQAQPPELLSQLTESEALTFADISLTAQAIFERHALKAGKTVPLTATSEKKRKAEDRAPRRQLFKFKFCYNCGRSVGVDLAPCSRCKEVHFCSNACKLASWNKLHKDECYITKGKARTLSKKKAEVDEKDGSKGNDGTEEEEGMEAEKGTESMGEMEGETMNWSNSTSLSMDLDNYSFN
ncbi:ankyrin repeat and MYND domain-containing protein 1 isoform X3 [Narcine bancroftii]|uniref:ankyrin repeat and MYND domain-containing protein 1 isoform X3 n=1 Tax=Narcine bancroftii TaxID=1343680 RepID=UPI0038316564